MKLFTFPHAQGIVVCGDIHGEFYQLIHKCCVQYGITDTLIIVAGDCGFGFETRNFYDDVYKKVQKQLARCNCWLVMLRGNHDNPAYFNTHPITHRRFMTIPDYSVLQACNHTILCVGGAVSVDRSYRKRSSQYHIPQAQEQLSPNVYWLDEAPVFDALSLCDINKKFTIDIVVTHTAPSFCELVSKTGLSNWIADDPDLLNELEAERAVMDRLHDALVAHHPLHNWYYGHFHQSWHCEIGHVMFHMLDIMEIHEVH